MINYSKFKDCKIKVLGLGKLVFKPLSKLLLFEHTTILSTLFSKGAQDHKSTATNNKPCFIFKDLEYTTTIPITLCKVIVFNPWRVFYNLYTKSLSCSFFKIHYSP